MSSRRESLTRNYPGIGLVTFRISPRAGRIRIQVKPDAGVSVVMPPGAHIGTAEQFLLSKQDWVLKSLARTAVREGRRTLFRPGMYYATRQHRLFMRPEDRRDVFTRVSGGEIHVRYPRDIPPETPLLQEATRKAILRALAREALSHLPLRTDELARKHGLQYARLSLRDNRSRWGSCSANGSISLNIHLMRLPDELIDYIILHELAHTVHPNHSPAFHQFLESLFPGHREAEKRLRHFSPSIF